MLSIVLVHLVQFGSDELHIKWGDSLTSFLFLLLSDCIVKGLLLSSLCHTNLFAGNLCVSNKEAVLLDNCGLVYSGHQFI